MWKNDDKMQSFLTLKGFLFIWMAFWSWEGFVGFNFLLKLLKTFWSYENVLALRKYNFFSTRLQWKKVSLPRKKLIFQEASNFWKKLLYFYNRSISINIRSNLIFSFHPFLLPIQWIFKAYESHFWSFFLYFEFSIQYSNTKIPKIFAVQNKVYWFYLEVANNIYPSLQLV